MKLFILDETFELENKIESVETIFDNIKSVDEVKVVMLSTKAVIRENLVTIDEYVERAIPTMNNLADRFQKGADLDDWDHISELFEGIGFIFYTLESIDTMGNLDEIVPNYSAWNGYVLEVKSLEEVLKELNIAVENKDETSISELLTSKVVPVFEKIKRKLESLVSID